MRGPRSLPCCNETTETGSRGGSQHGRQTTLLFYWSYLRGGGRGGGGLRVPSKRTSDRPRPVNTPTSHPRSWLQATKGCKREVLRSTGCTCCLARQCKAPRLRGTESPGRGRGRFSCTNGSSEAEHRRSKKNKFRRVRYSCPNSSSEAEPRRSKNNAGEKIF